MKKVIFILQLVCMFGSLLATTDTLFFDVSILGVRCAKVELIENILDDDRVEIVYHAYTVPPFLKLSPTDNWYYYYTNREYSHLDSLRKIIKDKDVRQNYSEIMSNETVIYNNDHVQKHNKPLHHILTSLAFFEHHPEAIQSGYDLAFDISDEGDFYHQEIKVKYNERKAQDEIYFSFKHIGGKEYIKETDVFNWMICAGNGTRMLAYSRRDGKIIEGAFSLGWGGLHLRAKRIIKP